MGSTYFAWLENGWEVSRVWLIGCLRFNLDAERGGGRIESWVRGCNSENQRDWNPKIGEYCRSASFSKTSFQVPAVSFWGWYFWLFVSKTKQKKRPDGKICLKLISTFGIGIAFPNGSGPRQIAGVQMPGPITEPLSSNPFFFQANSFFFCTSFGFVVPFPRLFFVLRGLQTRSRASGILPEGEGGGTCERFVEGGGFNQAYLGGRCPASSVGDYYVEKSTHWHWNLSSEVRTVKQQVVFATIKPLSLSLESGDIPHNFNWLPFFSLQCLNWYMISD